MNTGVFNNSMKQLDLSTLSEETSHSKVKNKPIVKDNSTSRSPNTESKNGVQEEFALQQLVEVVPPSKEEYDCEDYYYLLEFAGEKGRISKIHQYNSLLSYSVEFSNDKYGIFYKKDLILLSDKEEG
jgi:hypothetical protein